jgi:ABC-type amino acid transport system permease subunit
MSLLFEQTPDGAGRYLDWIVSGLGWTLSLALGAWTIALVVGTLVGVARTLPKGILPRLGRVTSSFPNFCRYASASRSSRWIRRGGVSSRR